MVVWLALGLGCTGDAAPDGPPASDTDTDTDTGAVPDTDTGTGALHEPVCGDGVIDDDEACDDGAANADDAACTSTCALASCGDGLVWAGVEGCDDGVDNADTAACKPTCEPAECGDGLLWADGEVCDDANPFGGDGCSPQCEPPAADSFLNADLVLYGAPGEGLGQAVAGGDLDGDGIHDLIVSAPDSGGWAGAVYVFYGPIDGTETVATADATILGQGSSTFLGGYMTSGSDLDGDGLHDIALSLGTYAGDVLVFHGPVYGTLTIADADAVLTTAASDDFLGWGLGMGGDINGDGVDDLLVSASGARSDRGVVYVVYGPVTGDIDLDGADAKLVGELEGDWVGEAVAIVGDTDGDGFDDVMVGSSLYPASARRGVAYLLRGPLTGEISLANADAKRVGERDERAGAAVAGAGDLNGDGLADVIVGAWNHVEAGNEVGAAYVLYGPVTGSADLATADAVFLGSTPSSSAGGYVAGAGDVDGDGRDDLLVSDSNFGGAIGAGTEQGAVHLVHGPVDAVSHGLARADLTLVGASTSDYTEYGIGCGDLNGDGIGDFAASAWSNDTAGTDAGVVYVVFGPR